LAPGSVVLQRRADLVEFDDVLRAERGGHAARGSGDPGAGP
jgi:hypothetical protein